MKEKIKHIYNRISYSILPFLFFVLILELSYTGNQLLYKFGITQGSNYPQIGIDSQIPLISWFVYPYFLTFPLALFTYFYLAYKDRKAFWNMYIALIVSFALSGIIYAFFQTEFTKPDFTPVTFTDKFVVWTWNSTYPINCFPSQHCFMAYAMIISCISAKKEKINMFFKIFTCITSILIVMATVFIRQHFLLDMVASFIIMFPIWALAYVFNWGEKLDKALQNRKEKRKHKKGEK